MSEELTPASCPDDGVATLHMCCLYKAEGASEWEDAYFASDNICIVPPGECEHRVTLCAECLESWREDHIVTLAPAGTPRPDIPEL